METTIAHPRKTRHAPKKVEQPKWQRITLLSILGYETAGCLSGGGLLVASPDGRFMKMPVDIMHGVFPDFLIPGLILIALGILNGFAFAAVLRRTRTAWIMAGLATGALIVWFLIEIAVLHGLHWLHAMWGIPVVVGWVIALPLAPSRGMMIRITLLICGILSSLLYAAMNVVVPMLYEGYSSFSQTVSELSAIGTPTRQLWVMGVIVYTILLTAFGWGVIISAGRNRFQRVLGILIIIHSVFGLFWPPMHQREVLAAGGGTITDSLHIAWTLVTVPLFILEVGFGAAAFGKGFRRYSIMTIVFIILFGVFTGLDSPGMEANLPTPWMGVGERLRIGAFMLWIAVIAIVLLGKEKWIAVKG